MQGEVLVKKHEGQGTCLQVITGVYRCFQVAIAHGNLIDKVIIIVFATIITIILKRKVNKGKLSYL